MLCVNMFCCDGFNRRGHHTKWEVRNNRCFSGALEVITRLLFCKASGSIFVSPPMPPGGLGPQGPQRAPKWLFVVHRF